MRDGEEAAKENRRAAKEKEEASGPRNDHGKGRATAVVKQGTTGLSASIGLRPAGTAARKGT